MEKNLKSEAVTLGTQVELLDTKRLVYSFLVADPKARNNDKWLQYLVFLYDTGLTQHALDFDTWQSARDMESIRRTRQLIVAEHPELDATEPDVLAKREARREGFRRFCGGKERI